MSRFITCRATLLALLLPCSAAIAQDAYVYPADGQSPEQMEADKFACHQFAVQQTGFDPTTMTATPVAPASQQDVGRGAGRGLLRGGAGGALVGAIAGNAGKGAAIGAATGAVVGGARTSNANQQQAQAQQQQQQAQDAAHQQNLDRYQRASAACLEGRGYTVR